MTICNLAVELGAKIGVVAPDDVTFEYITSRRYAPSGGVPALRTNYPVVRPDSSSAARDDNRDGRAHAAQNARSRHCVSIADLRRSMRNRAQGHSRNGQLRGDLAPVSQSADKITGWEFVGHNDFISGI